MSKENLAYTYNGIFLVIKRKKSYHMINIDESWGYCANWNKPVTQGQILPDFPYLKYLKESES